MEKNTAQKLDPRVYMAGQRDRRYVTAETRELLASHGMFCEFSFGLYEIRKGHDCVKTGLAGDAQIRQWLAQYVS